MRLTRSRPPAPKALAIIGISTVVSPVDSNSTPPRVRVAAMVKKPTASAPASLFSRKVSTALLLKAKTKVDTMVQKRWGRTRCSRVSSQSRPPLRMSARRNCRVAMTGWATETSRNSSMKPSSGTPIIARMPAPTRFTRLRALTELASTPKRPWPLATEMLNRYQALVAEASSATSANKARWPSQPAGLRKGSPARNTAPTARIDQPWRFWNQRWSACAPAWSPRPSDSETNRIADVVSPWFIRITSTPESQIRYA